MYSNHTNQTRGVKAKIHRNGILCPGSGTEPETESGVYRHNEAIVANGTSGELEVEIDMGGE